MEELLCSRCGDPISCNTRQKDGRTYYWCGRCRVLLYQEEGSLKEIIKKEFLETIINQMKEHVKEENKKLLPLIDSVEGLSKQLETFLKTEAEKYIVLSDKNQEAFEKNSQEQKDFLQETKGLLLNMIHSVENSEEAKHKERMKAIEELVQRNAETFWAQSKMLEVQRGAMKKIEENSTEYFEELNKYSTEYFKQLNEYNCCLQKLMLTANEKLNALSNDHEQIINIEKENNERLKGIEEWIKGRGLETEYDREMRILSQEMKGKVDCPFCEQGKFDGGKCNVCGLTDMDYYQSKAKEKSGWDLSEAEKKKIERLPQEIEQRVWTFYGGILSHDAVDKVANFPKQAEDVQLVRLKNVHQIKEFHSDSNGKYVFSKFKKLQAIIIEEPSQLSIVDLDKEALFKLHEKMEEGSIKIIGKTMEKIDVHEYLFPKGAKR